MKNYNKPSDWKYASPESEGMHKVITPENSPCKLTWVFRLNISKGKHYILQNTKLELNGVVIHGCIKVTHNKGHAELNKLDSFYLPGDEMLNIDAIQDSIIFIGGSLFEGKGSFYTRMFDLSLPLGHIHQIHGEPPYQREVFMTISQQDEGSRLICGITMGEEGKWTSWPPHQHTNDLEEVYCYFDIPRPKSAFHFSSRKSGEFEFIHPVSTGDFVVIPEGYHPTCGMPGIKSCYFWVMASLSPKSRRYDLAISDFEL